MQMHHTFRICEIIQIKPTLHIAHVYFRYTKFLISKNDVILPCNRNMSEPPSLIYLKAHLTNDCDPISIHIFVFGKQDERHINGSSSRPLLLDLIIIFII